MSDSLRQEITNDILSELSQGDLRDASVDFVVTQTDEPTLSSVDQILGPAVLPEGFSYHCTNGIVSGYSVYERSSTAIKEGDVKLVCFQLNMPVTPTIGDEIAIEVREEKQLYSVESIEEDPARVTYELQLRPKAR